MDLVFKALADGNRRTMLDLIRDQPGINVNELSSHFEFSRYATMKHLKVLEEAELVVARREWKEKQLYLNATPLQTIYDRWISGYTQKWATSLAKLKHRAEEDS